MAKSTRPTTYNAQQLGKAVREMTPEQRADPYWWTYLGPKWDHWSLPQLKELIRLAGAHNEQFRTLGRGRAT